MNNKKIINKLNEIFLKHSGDNGFHINPDAIGKYFFSLGARYEKLYNLSRSYLLKWQDVKEAQTLKNEIRDIVEKMKKDEKVKSFVRGNKHLLSNIVKGAEELRNIVYEKKPTDTTIEIEIAKNVLNKLWEIEKEEIKHFPISVQMINQNRNKMNYQWQGYDYDLFLFLKEAKKLFESVGTETQPEFQDQLNTIFIENKKVYQTIIKNVIEHYDELNKIDREIHNKEIFCRIDAESLRKKYDPDEIEIE